MLSPNEHNNEEECGQREIKKSVDGANVALSTVGNGNAMKK